MEKALEELTASVLRNLLIVEVKKFIACLEYSSTEELQEMKLHLKKILDLITKKELAEVTPLTWGKNSTHAEKANPQSDSISEMISGSSSA
jgi:hypothetical protein